MIFNRRKPICDSKELRRPALNSSINSVFYKKREKEINKSLSERNLQIMSKLLDLEGMGGKGTESHGNVPQLCTCAVVLTVPIGAVQSWAAQLMSLPQQLFQERFSVSFYWLEKKKKKAKQTKEEKRTKPKPKQQPIFHRTDLLLKTLCNVF